MSNALNLISRTDDDRRQHPYCQDCKIACGAADKDWSIVTKKCHGIFDEQDYKELAEKNDISIQEVKELIDPAEWIYQNLGMLPYWYQHRTLKCTSIRRALRWGRRCVVKDTPILCANGSWKPIQDFVHNDKVASRNSKPQIVGKKVISPHYNGVKDVYRVTLSNNLSIECTSNHPFLSFDTGYQLGMKRVWKSIDDGLKPGNRVMTIAKYDKWGKIHNPELGKLIGYLLTDGYMTGGSQSTKFTNNNIRMIDEVESIAIKLFGYKCSKRSKGNGWDIYITHGIKGEPNKLNILLQEEGILGLKSKRKILPKNFNKWDKETALACINRMFSGDGCVFIGKKNGNRIPTELCLVSQAKPMLNQIRLTLLKLDIISRIDLEERVTNKSNGKLSKLYRLRISDAKSIENFFNEVGPIYGKEAKSLEMIDAIAKKAKRGRRKTRGKHFSHYKIKSIEYIGKKETFDIEVKDTHNYIANGIVTHNTGKTETIAAYILYVAYTNAKKKILCVTPAKAQGKEINDRIHKLINDGNPKLKADIVRDVQQPYYEIVFANESRIRFFVAGQSGGANAGAQVRGQEADLIFIDEMDYLDDAAATAILPILSDPVRDGQPVEFIASTTPTGRESQFFHMCQNDNYKEFHFPSWCRPDWNEEREAEARQESRTKAGYEHEYLAEWGTKSDGIFRRSDVLQAQEKYRYNNDLGFAESVDWPEMKPYPSHWRYIMGVDWNGPGNGTRIIIVGYDPTRNKFILVYREGVSVDEFSLSYSIERMVEINRIWRCQSAYIDAGYGQMQDETLRSIGRAARNAQLNGKEFNGPDLMWEDSLHSVDFGGWLTYDTTEEGKPVERKVPIKNYMVENFQRFFEQKDFWFSRSDEDLKQQLLGYTSPRQSAKGFPIYKADPEAGDHDLDAVMLALFGFNQEMSPEFRKKGFLRDFAFVEHEALRQPALPDPMSNPLDYERAVEKQKADKQEKIIQVPVPSREIIKPGIQRIPLSNQMITIRTKNRQKSTGGGAVPKSRTAFLKKGRRHVR